MENNRNNSLRLLDRNVWCLFGLPIDVATVSTTKQYIHLRSVGKSTSVWSTVNVNWLILSIKDKEFRNAIIQSDFVTIDGKLLLWIAKLLRYPMPQAVAGSSIIQDMQEDTDATHIRTIFFFGGEAEAGKKAVEKVNRAKGGMRALGYICPGFGTVEEMSDEKYINLVNQANPDILLVALGAQKGMQWIDKNRNRLKAKIVSHLGATVNFLAGTVKRAPRWMQANGLEWLWRTIQEPKLIKRYLLDGLLLFWFLGSQLPIFFYYFRQKKKYNGQILLPKINQENKGHARIIFGTCVNLDISMEMRTILSSLLEQDIKITFDLNETHFFDGAFAALLLIINFHQLNPAKDIKIETSPVLDKLFEFYRIPMPS
jgi:N-acetylglucosaminyldiphosphoundecaprenol N-acetyl-beta-D-mannosaminyltransferase